MTLRLGFLVSHPIQYYAPIFRELAKRCDLTVFFAHRQTAEGHARAGYGVAFEWDVDLLSGYESRFLTNVSKRPSTDVFAGCDTPGVAEEITQGRFDAFVVPGWGLRSYLQAVSACRKARVPVLVRGDSQFASERGGLLRLVKALVFPRFLERFDRFLYVGQRNREYLEHYGVRSDQLFFSPHCVDNDAFRQGSEAARRARPAASSGRRRILLVGKLVESKRPYDVIRAAAVIQGGGGQIEVAFAGAGEAEAALKQAATDARVSAVFHGFVNQSELPAVYAAADVVVSPSVETWGLVVNEAMACGVPSVVSSAVGCAPDLIEEGRTGAVFPLGDIPGLARAIGTVLTFDADRTRDAIAMRLAVYSPKRTVQGIIDAGSAALRGTSQSSSGL
ncbi:glycosyltransferase family 4 protein [Reyranella sp.]|uniref:glycosyltransferase family 4 protein n=1 Tax=Reyranella sp. TaxID=1929291 RepID=UPI003D0BA168